MGPGPMVTMVLMSYSFTTTTVIMLPIRLSAAIDKKMGLATENMSKSMPEDMTPKIAPTPYAVKTVP